MKQIIFSGIKPSGDMHVGGYIGAIQNWVNIQDNPALLGKDITDAELVFCIVDLHAITVYQDPKILKKRTRELLGLYIACGLDPNKCHLFIQSDNPDHTYLAWIFDCIINMGQLERMTQYKDKKDKIMGDFLNNQFKILLEENKNIKKLNPEINNLSAKEEITITKSALFNMLNTTANPLSVGLFNYPALMAADILLYGTTHVPVGEDQRQHVELTRDIAEKFNRKYGEVFTLPQAVIGDYGKRIMSLQRVNEKMSKSEDDTLGTIYLLDNKETIEKKIAKAVTDSLPDITYDKLQRPAVANLLEIFASFDTKGRTCIELAQHYHKGGFGTFKKDLTNIVWNRLSVIQDKFALIIENTEYLDSIIESGGQWARKRSFDNLKKVRLLLGL